MRGGNRKRSIRKRLPVMFETVRTYIKACGLDGSENKVELQRGEGELDEQNPH